MNAKRRRKEFTLTYKQFEEFCKRTGYNINKGRNAECLSIDRIDDKKGYTIDNIQAITISENITKSNLYERLPKDLIPELDKPVPF